MQETSGTIEKRPLYFLQLWDPVFPLSLSLYYLYPVKLLYKLTLRLNIVSRVLSLFIEFKRVLQQ